MLSTAHGPHVLPGVSEYDHVMIQIPQRPGQLILDHVAMRLRPLLDRGEFLKFCEERNLLVSAELLHHLEAQRAFTPIIRVHRPRGDSRILHVDGNPTASDFAAGWVVDCSAPEANYALPDFNASESMPFYSEFQVWALERVLGETTVTFQFHEIAGPSVPLLGWNKHLGRLRAQAEERAARLSSDPELIAIPILCQAISNRYLPHALSNQRSYRVGDARHFSNEWMAFERGSWDWQSYREEWDPAEVAAPFAFDEESLERVHWRMINAMHQCDPLWRWRNLLQFVNQRKRDELRGDALRAELYRHCAEMLRCLFRDLYRSDLGSPEEALTSGPSLNPEPAVREDPRKHLQFVANQYDLNPQPKAVLFVEGETEVAFAHRVFRGLFGMHHGVPGIEVMNLHGVDNATGRKTDGSVGIVPLVDYLLEHQTLVFVMLDNEGRARNLQSAAPEKHSIFGSRRRAIAGDRVLVWDRCFELDNFTDEELATAMVVAAEHRVEFDAAEIRVVRSDWQRESLAKLYRLRSGTDLKKPDMAEALAERVIESPSFPDGSRRPIVDFLLRVSKEASRNHLPLTQEVWRQNQDSLDVEHPV